MIRLVEVETSKPYVSFCEYHCMVIMELLARSFCCGHPSERCWSICTKGAPFKQRITRDRCERSFAVNQSSSFSCHSNIPASLENQARKRRIQAHIARGLACTLGVLVCGCTRGSMRPIWWHGWRPARPLMMRWMHDVCHFRSPWRNQRILVAVVAICQQFICF